MANALKNRILAQLWGPHLRPAAPVDVDADGTVGAAAAHEQVGPVVRLHHSDEIPTAVLENTERDKERSGVEGKVKAGDWRGIFESRFIAPQVSGSERQEFTGSVRGARDGGRKSRTPTSWSQLRSYRGAS